MPPANSPGNDQEGVAGPSTDTEYAPPGRKRPRPVASGVWFASKTGMDTWVALIVFLVVWIALQVWVLPRLGVPT